MRQRLPYGVHACAHGELLTKQGRPNNQRFCPMLSGGVRGVQIDSAIDQQVDFVRGSVKQGAHPVPVWAMWRG